MLVTASTASGAKRSRASSTSSAPPMKTTLSPCIVVEDQNGSISVAGRTARSSPARQRTSMRHCVHDDVDAEGIAGHRKFQEVLVIVALAFVGVAEVGVVSHQN